MSLLVIMMCLIGQSCDEATSPWVVRKQMTTGECKGYAAALVSEIVSNKLNPDNGYFVVQCRPVEPKA
jgi:hypothetical protein